MQVFNIIGKEMVIDIMEGYNGTIFAYGSLYLINSFLILINRINRKWKNIFNAGRSF